MMNKLFQRCRLLIVMLLLSLPSQAQILDVDIPRSELLQQVGWVNDFEGMFTDEEEDMLSRVIGAYEVETSIEIVVVTLPEDIIKEERLFDTYVFELGNNWGVGKAGKDNGVVIGFSKAYRKIRISNGYGVEDVLSDVETREVIEDYFVPHFKKGEYYLGCRAGVERLMNLLRVRMNN